MNTRIEQLTQVLGELYGSYGYRPYTMSKFEEYGLYLRNKDFLISDRILTFTDTDGKLMALKPDVTLSIIKNTRPTANAVEKMFYRENVYRPGNAGFREILQVGLECMGAVDDYCILEVLLLAVKSLRAIGRSSVLDISHMGLLSLLLDRYGLEGETRRQVTEAIGGKNLHTIRALCGEGAEDLCQLVRLSGKPSQVLPGLKNIFGTAPQLVQLQKLVAALEKAGCDGINIDFSVVNDMRYYNGIVFRGFVEGVPTGVLSGGQYDAMMANMGRPDKAIGFAIYPELLERLETATQKTVMDAVLLYAPGADLTALCAAVEALAEKGMTVKALPEGSQLPECRAVYKLEGNEVKEYA
ncbi:MAG: ATP phosphoribosyltransferase regulatory subunit [Oscillospiraceae bacterium]|nr:ATP phosphoribosyltransferase regulatory subunit [Oscillospiraceae bacterium]